MIIGILFSIIKCVNYRLHKFFDLAVRSDDTVVDNQKPLINNNNKDIEEEPKLLNQRTTIDTPSAETQ